MSNVIDFTPKGEMEVEFDAIDEDRVNYVAHQLTCVMAGVDAMTEVTWQEIFQGALLATIFAGQTAGYEPEDVEEAFHSMRITDGDNEGC